jgi:hypothetical protein
MRTIFEQMKTERIVLLDFIHRLVSQKIEELKIYTKYQNTHVCIYTKYHNTHVCIVIFGIYF